MGKTLAVLIGAGLCCSGCGTLIHGTMQRVPVSSDPPGATVHVGNARYTTPTVIDLPRNRAHIIVVTLDGYHAEQVVIDRQLSPIIIGNVIFGLAGIAAAAVDLSAGGAWRLRPEAVAVYLPRMDDTEWTRGPEDGAGVLLREPQP
jgi:hypothetical protein